MIFLLYTGTSALIIYISSIFLTSRELRNIVQLCYIQHHNITYILWLALNAIRCLHSRKTFNQTIEPACSLNDEVKSQCQCSSKNQTGLLGQLWLPSKDDVYLKALLKFTNSKHLLATAVSERPEPAGRGRLSDLHVDARTSSCSRLARPVVITFESKYDEPGS